MTQEPIVSLKDIQDLQGTSHAPHLKVSGNIFVSIGNKLANI